MPPRKPKAAAPAPVESLTHPAATRLNTPTRETVPFLADEPAPPVMYPRDPGRDPQVVWRGKDKQDA